MFCGGARCTSHCSPVD
uniref:Uncharacterized protein n=1 Tax=Anguilla anguilla TaxID=7936 RepID=A0A0E9T8L5_ANGAN